VMGRQRFLQLGGMQGERAGVEYKIAAYKGVAFKGEGQHNPMREPFFASQAVRTRFTD
jgi:hypothetical protein